MKIIALDSSFANNEIKFGKITLKFKGIIAEVEDDKIGEQLIAKYNTVIADSEKYEPKNTFEPQKKNFKTTEEERLEKLLEISDIELAKVKKERDNATQDLAFWKNLYDDINSKYKALKSGIMESKEEPVLVPNNIKQDTDFENEMRNAHPNTLKKICRELKYPEEEWVSLSNKADLAEYVIKKANE